MGETGSVIVIDDKPNMLKMLTALLGESYEVRSFESGKKGLEGFRERPGDVIVTDIKMPDLDGMEVLKRIKGESPETEVILMTAYGEVSQAVEAVKRGAYNYITKPFEPEAMLLAVEKALERKRLRERTRILQQEVEQKFGFANIVGNSEPMKRAYDLARKAAATDTTVLLTGESGTGKEVFARAIHYSSARATRRFVAINCGAMPKELMESELFGHLKGAYTGATKDKPGLFEEANGGTLFLDEITELAPDLQVKINRAIQEKEIRRVGDTRDRPVDARIIASTNRDLTQAIQEGRLREDLYYRLNVFPVHLPPLRERGGDISLLMNYFLKEFTGDEAERYEVTPEAMQQMLSYSWPGNVRELRNAIERAVILSEDRRITPELLSLPGSHTEGHDPQLAALRELSYREAMEKISTDAQRRYLVEVLKVYEGNVTKAAEHAGIERESFHRLMRKCNIKAEDIKRDLARQ